jgi:hypothetical protein
MITVKKRSVIVAVGMIAVLLTTAAPADADPADDPCQLAVSFLCRLVPIAPDLDHNIDLTQEPAIVNGQPLPETPAGTLPEDTPPADICLNGCI